jgi:hypothetical protein
MAANWAKSPTLSTPNVFFYLTTNDIEHRFVGGHEGFGVAVEFIEQTLVRVVLGHGQHSLPSGQVVFVGLVGEPQEQQETSLDLGAQGLKKINLDISIIAFPINRWEQCAYPMYGRIHALAAHEGHKLVFGQFITICTTGKELLGHLIFVKHGEIGLKNKRQ